MLVIDASALVEVLTSDPDENPVLIKRLVGADWMSAPYLLDYELHNVLRKMTSRGDIDEDLATAARLTFRQLRIVRHALSESMSDRVWVLRHNVSGYDASYLALAEELQVPLVTTERRLAGIPQTVARTAIESYAR